MKYEVVVPMFAEGAEEISLRQWLKNTGDPVTKGENIAEAATDKISVYIESPADGIFSEQLVPEGDRVQVGAVIGLVEG